MSNVAGGDDQIAADIQNVYGNKSAYPSYFFHYTEAGAS